jgi:acetyltransferase-like isoleucine patch superfamily enzyme
MAKIITKLLTRFYRLKRNLFVVYLRDNLQYLGKEVVVEPSVYFENMDKIHLDDFCRIHHGATLVGKSTTRLGIYLGKRTTVREFAHLNAYSGYIITGKNVYIGQGSIVSGHGGIEIGDNTLIANLCSITASNHIFTDSSIPLRFQGETSLGIKIGANVWIASKVTILDGVTIGDNAVISAGSVVVKDIPSWAIAAGVPVRIIKDRRDI